ncbi:baseplate wedge subunit protein [Rhizobium phage RHph_I1_18]|nr:baseplate wedge subunit protein [Rhizobium phage RHph_I1_18]
MSDLFDKLPRITYNGYLATDLTVRAEIYKKILRQVPVFYNYSIKDGERPDTVAYDYYGSEDYTWLVLLSANVYNIYTDWPLTYQDFRKYLLKKYGNITTIMSDVDHYEYVGVPGTDSVDDISRKSWTLSQRSYLALSTPARAGWSAVTVYQNEERSNEAKRKIKLLSNSYIDQVDTELEAVFSGSQ